MKKLLKYYFKFLCTSIALLLVLNITNAQDNDISKNNRFESLLKTSKEGNLSTQEREKFALEAIKIAEDQNNETKKVKALESLGIIKLSIGNYSEAYFTFEKAIQILSTSKEKNIDPKQKVILYNMAGITLKNLNINDKALSLYQKALKTTDSIQWKKGKSIVYNNLFELYYIQENYKKSYTFLIQAHKINQQNKDSLLLFDTTNNLLLYHLKSGQDSIDYYVKKALSISKKSNNNYNQSFILNNLGAYYLEKKQPKKSLTYLNKSLTISKQNGFQEIITQSLYSLSELYYSKKDYSKSLNTIQEGKKICSNLKMDGLITRYLKLESKIYAKQKNYQRAYEAQNKSEKLKLALENKKKNLKQNELEKFYKFESQGYQKQLSKKELEIIKTQNRNYLIIGFSILILGLLIALYSYFIIRKNKQLKKQNEIISNQKEKELLLELDYKNRKLTTLSIGKINEKEYYNEIINDLNQVIYSKINPTNRQQLISIRNKITNEISHDVWEDFKTYFEEIHPSFNKKIMEHYPKISSTNLKLCAFIKLGFSTKEIAVISHKSTRTIESSRLKLRKMFNLNNNESLETFIKSNF